MADDDDKRGSRDNTGQEPKPEHALNRENAPAGHIGTNRISAPGLGLGGGTKRTQATQAGEQSQAGARQPDKAQSVKDTRDGFPETSDKDVNKFYGKTERMIPKSSPEHPAHPDYGKPAAEEKSVQLSQSDLAKAFRRVRDSNAGHFRSKGQGQTQ